MAHIVTSGKSSQGVIRDDDYMTVLKGGTAKSTTVIDDGRLFISSGGKANYTSVGHWGSMYVFSGGVANSTTVNGYGKLYLSGGTANSTTVSGQDGLLFVSSGGVANNTTVSSGAALVLFSGGVANNTTVNSESFLTVSSGGAANNTTVNTYMTVYVEGTVNNTTLNSDGDLSIESGGKANKTTVNAGGSLYISSGGKQTGQLTIAYGGQVAVCSSAILEFDISTSVPGAAAQFNDLSRISGWTDAIFSLMVSGSEADGSYTLADGASGFNKTITVVNTAGTNLGTLSVGQTASIDGVNYTLSLADGTLNVTRGATPSNTRGGGAIAYTSVTIVNGGETIVSSGQSANGATLRKNDEVAVSSGGLVTNFKISGGYLNVCEGGLATDVKVSEGYLYVYEGGSATNVNWTPCQGDGYVNWESGAYVTFADGVSGVYYGHGNGKLASHSIVMSSIKMTTRYDNQGHEYSDEMYVLSGGTAVNITVGDDAFLYVYEGGTLVDPKFVGAWGAVSSGGKLTGKITLPAGAISTFFIVQDGAIIDFDLTRTSPGAAPLVNNLLPLGASFRLDDMEYYDGDYTLTVNGKQANGTYKLAEGAPGFSNTITVVDKESGASLGTLNIGEKATINGKTYLLNLSGSSLTVTLSGGTAVVDTTAPQISLITGSPATAAAESVTISATFTDNVGVVATYYKLGKSGAWQLYSNSVTVYENTTVYFKAVDAAGNESKEASYQVTNIPTTLVNVVSGTVVSAGESAVVSANDVYKDTTVSGGRMYVMAGGTANNTIIEDALMYNEEYDDEIVNVGSIDIFSGGTASGVILSGYGRYDDFSEEMIYYGGLLDVYSGGMADDVTVLSGAMATISCGGKANDVTVSSGGKLYVKNGGTATNIVWTPCEGDIIISSGGIATFASQYSGVYLGSDNHLVSHAAMISEKTIDASGKLYVMSGGSADNMTVNGECEDAPTAGNGIYVMSGGKVTNTNVMSGGNLYVSSGGTAEKTFVFYDEEWLGVFIFDGGTAIDTVLGENGVLHVRAGGSADKINVMPGGGLYVSSGGTATNITWTPCEGRVSVENGAYVTFADKLTGVYYGSDGELISHTAVMIGKELTEESCEMNVMSGGTAFRTEVASGTMTVFCGGSANSVTLYGGDAEWEMEYIGSLYVSSGGTATNIDVSSGAYVGFDVAPDTFVQGTSDGRAFEMKNGFISGYSVNGGKLYVASGGTATDIVVERGDFAVASGGTANNVFFGMLDSEEEWWNPETMVDVYGVLNNAVISSKGWVFGCSGGVLNSVTLYDGGRIDIESGGRVNDLVVSGGYVDIELGSVVSNITVDFAEQEEYGEENDDEYYYSPRGVGLGSNAKLTGRITILNGTISTDIGSILDFDLTQTSAEATALVNDLSKIEDMPLYTLTVDGTQENGIYNLAEGASEFDGVITVVNTSGEDLGTLTVGGEGFESDGKKYTLALYGSILAATIGDAIPDNGPDEPDNNELYYSKTRTVNEQVTLSYGTHISKLGDEVRIDRIGTVDEDDYHNRVGSDDRIDYGKITLDSPAKLSFRIDATNAATFTLYSITAAGKDAGGKTLYAAKALQSTALVLNRTTKLYSVETKSLLLNPLSSADDPNVGYYVSVTSTNSRAEDVFYNVTFNSANGKSHIYADGDDNTNDSLYNSKTRTLNERAKEGTLRDAVIGCEDESAGNASIKDKLIMVDDDAELVNAPNKTLKNYVGFGDTTDFAKISPAAPAALTFTLDTTDSAYVVVYKLAMNAKNQWVQSIVGYKLVNVNKTAQPNGNSGTTATFFLDRLSGTGAADSATGYYVSVLSQTASKGGEAYYNVTASGKLYLDSDTGTNNTFFNTKTPSFYNGDLKKTEVPVGAKSTAIQLEVGEGDTSVHKESGGKTYANFVGFGDAIDYAEIQISETGTYQFSIDAYYEKGVSALAFRVYSLTYNAWTGKYVAKAVTALTVAHSRNRNDSYVSNLLSAKVKLTEDANTHYFVAMQSTGAAKYGDSVYYNVTLNNLTSGRASLAMPETDSLGISDAMSFGQKDMDALADASASALSELDDKSAGQLLSMLA